MISCINIKNHEIFTFDMDYFLNDKLMPLSLMVLDNSSSSQSGSAAAMARNSEDPFLIVDTDDGSFTNAFSTMGFHRKMMNEFHCNNYVAEEILMDLVPVQPKKMIQKRILKTSSTHARDLSEAMKSDEGSTNYKNWLSRTTSFDDIYRRFSLKNSTGELQKPKGFEVRREYQTPPDYSEDYEEGIITGYAVRVLSFLAHFLVLFRQRFFLFLANETHSWPPLSPLSSNSN